MSIEAAGLSSIVRPSSLHSEPKSPHLLSLPSLDHFKGPFEPREMFNIDTILFAYPYRYPYCRAVSRYPFMQKALSNANSAFAALA